jgi:hypothetical protein
LLLRITEDKANSSRGSGRWLGLRPGHPVLGGGRRSAGERRWVLRARGRLDFEGCKLLTSMQSLGCRHGLRGSGNKGDRRRRPSFGGGAGVARFGGGRRSFGCGIPRASRAGGEERSEEVEELFTGDEELRASVNGVAAGFLWRRRVWEQGESPGARLMGGQLQRL